MASEDRERWGVDTGPLERAERQNVRLFLRSGEHDPSFRAWRGRTTVGKCIRGTEALEDALVDEVARRSSGAAHQLPEVDVTPLTRAAVQPMVDGLFALGEREAVQAVLERSVIFLTPQNLVEVLMSRAFPHSAWTLANLYLASVGAELLGPAAPSLLGMSEDTTCYVSLEYFRTRGPFDDYVVHEAAHIFHNCKRERLSLPFTRRRLLDIAFGKRETFAYACEAFSRIAAGGVSRAQRLAKTEEWAEAPAHDESVDIEELRDIVREAARSRNGWKTILRRCAPTRLPASNAR
jgi:hypothetical protein